MLNLIGLLYLKLTGVGQLQLKWNFTGQS